MFNIKNLFNTPNTSNNTVSLSETPEQVYTIDSITSLLHDINSESGHARLQILMSRIKELFDGCGVDRPFYIAGGSVFSIFTGTHKYHIPSDIDVFFYSEDDLTESMKKLMQISTSMDADTSNAYTMMIKDTKFQFIKRRIGPPEHVMNTFDISCSMISYTSDGQLLKGSGYDSNAIVKSSPIYADSIHRYIKYVTLKGAERDEKSESKLIQFLIDNYDEILDDYYKIKDAKGKMIVDGVFQQLTQNAMFDFGARLMREVFKNNVDSSECMEQIAKNAPTSILLYCNSRHYNGYNVLPPLMYIYLDTEIKEKYGDSRLLKQGHESTLKYLNDVIMPDLRKKHSEFFI